MVKKGIVLSPREKVYEELKKQYKNTPLKLKSKVNDVLDLYKSGSIFNKVSAQSMINQLLTPSNNPQKQLAKHYQSMIKYLTNTFSTQISSQQRQHKHNKEQQTMLLALSLSIGRILKCRQDGVAPRVGSNNPRTQL